MAIENGEQLLAMMRGFQVSSVLAAGADLDVFNLLSAAPLSAAEVADRLRCDRRAMTILLDADQQSFIGAMHDVACTVAEPLIREVNPGGFHCVLDVGGGSGTGALFAVNMLVATAGGGTYTLAEIRDDLHSAGFEDTQLIRRDEGMHAVVSARRV